MSNQITHIQEAFIKTKQNVISAMVAGIVPFVRSSPGMGKSAMFREIAKELNLVFLDFRASEMDPTEVKGFPFVNKITNKASYAPTDLIPIKGDTIPEGKKGWLLLCDELISAPPATQAAMYRLILDRKVGDKDIHPNVIIGAAGNLDTDNAVVEEMSTALKSRMATFYLKSSFRDWMGWASSNNINKFVMSYLNFKKSALNNFNPVRAMEESNFACERTWEFTSNALNKKRNEHLLKEPNKHVSFFAGLLGEAIGNEFAGFISVASEVITVDDILANPSIEQPKKAEQKWTLALNIAEAVCELDDTGEIGTLLDYLFSMSLEFQTIALSKIYRDDTELFDTNHKISDWLIDKADYLF